MKTCANVYFTVESCESTNLLYKWSVTYSLDYDPENILEVINCLICFIWINKNVLP
jgi:hypothetical protein